MTPIHILHVVDTLETGGLENGVANLIGTLNPERFKHEICAIRNLGPLSDRLASRNVRLDCLNKTQPGFSLLVGPLWRRIAAMRPDIVHARNSGTMEAILAGRLAGRCGLVYSEHGTESRAPEPALRRLLRSMVFRAADRVVTVSNELKDFHSQRTLFPAPKISVVHNGVDTERFRPRPDIRMAMRQQWGISPDAFCLGAIGRLEPVKDHATLLRAATRLAGNIGEWRLFIAGEGSQSGVLREMVNATPALSRNVLFAGEIGNVKECLACFDVYVLPSISEGISNSLLEAMAAGLPVVATEAGGNREVVVHGESGLLFRVGDDTALADCLLRLHGDTGFRSELAGGALKRVRDHFSLDSMVRKYASLYSNLVRARNGHNVAENEACT